MDITLLATEAQVFNRTQDANLTRIAMFVANKTVNLGGFKNEPKITYPSILDAKSYLLIELSVYLSGYQIRVYADTYSYSIPIVRFSTDEHQGFLILEQIENQLYIH